MSTDNPYYKRIAKSAGNITYSTALSPQTEVSLAALPEPKLLDPFT